jgi:hypothetical protein
VWSFERSTTFAGFVLLYGAGKRAMRNHKISDFQACTQVLQWMDAHDDALPLLLKKPTTDAQRAVYLLRCCFNNLKPKTDHSPEVRALLDEIFQQRSRRAARLASTTKCKKVLEWMDAHEETLPLLLMKPTTDAQRAELLLRRQYNYIRRKTNPSLELRAVLEEIQSRMSFVLSIMSIEIHIHCDLFQQQW